MIGVALLAVTLSACGSNGRPAVSISQVSGSTQSNGHYPGAIVALQVAAKPAVTLTDTAGQPYDMAAQTPGRVTLLYFGYTHCPDVCPINMALAAAAIRLLPASERSRVVTVFITTDPDRDTPSVIRAWLNEFSPDFVGLTGSIAQIHTAEQDVGMPLSDAGPAAAGGGYQVQHAGYILAYSQDNKAHLEFYDTESQAGFAASLEHLLAHGYQA